jgi:hypothetical protein
LGSYEELNPIPIASSFLSFSWSTPGQIQLGREVEGHPQLGQPLDDGLDARDSFLALRRQERHQPRVVG